MFRRNWRTAVAAIALVSLTLSGVRPAQAWAPPPVVPPPVVAPPAVGLCSTPVAVMVCAAGVLVLVGSEAAQWTIGEGEAVDPYSVGYAYDPDAEQWEWCGLAGTEQRCNALWEAETGHSEDPEWVEAFKGPRVIDGLGGDFEGVNADLGYPGTWSELWINQNEVLTHPRGEMLLVVREESGQDAALAIGAQILGGTIKVVEDGRGVQIDVWLKDVGGLPPCPSVEVPESAFTSGLDQGVFFPEWVSCKGASLAGARGLDGSSSGRVWRWDSITCSAGEAEYVGVSGGLHTMMRGMCPEGETVEGFTYAGASNPSQVSNHHFPLRICQAGVGGVVSNQSSCRGPDWGSAGERVAVSMTLVDEPVPVRQAVLDFMCRAEDGSLTLRTAYGAPTPVFNPSVPLPNPSCLPGEVPVSWEGEICPVGVTEGECESIGTGGSVFPDDLTEAEWECIQLLATPNPCPMWLEVWDGSEWDYCDPALLNCEGWWTHPEREAVFRCGWGGTYYTASQCVALKDFYDGEDEDTEVVTPNPEMEPDPTTTGDPVQIGGPQNPVSMRPSQSWFRRLVNEWWTGTTPSMQNACWPQGWGLLNPIQWVMRPTICALTFSFVPTTSLEVRLDRLKTEFETRTGISPDIVSQVVAPSVGGQCGWGIGGAEGLFFDWPTVDVVLCPEEYGVQAQANLSRGLGYGVLGFWAVGTIMRWVAMRSAPDEVGEQLTLF